MEEALANLVAKYQKRPSAELARMIRQLEIEIAERKTAAALDAAHCGPQIPDLSAHRKGRKPGGNR